VAAKDDRSASAAGCDIDRSDHDVAGIAGTGADHVSRPAVGLDRDILDGRRGAGHLDLPPGRSGIEVDRRDSACALDRQRGSAVWRDHEGVCDARQARHCDGPARPPRYGVDRHDGATVGARVGRSAVWADHQIGDATAGLVEAVEGRASLARREVDRHDHAGGRHHVGGRRGPAGWRHKVVAVTSGPDRGVRRWG
jgi:hypothetical protein